MSKTFDLFGDPVPPNHGRRGRPSHIDTEQNRNKVTMLLALGWSNERIAAALSISAPTLMKHYFSILEARAIQRDRMESAIAMKLWEGLQAGNVAAAREFRALIERNDRMGFEEAMGETSTDQVATAPAARVGKKAGDMQRAIDADADLTAELEQEAAQNVTVN